MEPSPEHITHTSYNHLIQGDLAPIGRVHLVSMGRLTGDLESQHFLAEMDADANMGAKRMLDASRRGPFKSHTGRSRVMDRSAHVTYRRRGHRIEIEIARGVTAHELDTLMGKLAGHRMSTVHSHVFIVNGRRRKLGLLNRINLEKLRTMIHEILEKRRKVGLLVSDDAKHGLMHKPSGHTRVNKAVQRTLAD